MRRNSLSLGNITSVLNVFLSTFIESFFMKKHNLQFMVVSTEVVSPRLWFYRNQLAQEVFSLQDLKICKYVPGGHSLMLLWFADLMNVTEEVTNHQIITCSRALASMRKL